MTQYIDKSAILAEIEKLKGKADDNSSYSNGWKHSLRMIEIFINSINTKDVDLEKEFYDFLDTLIGKDNGHLSEDELLRIAEYFYELGLKAKNE